MCTAYQYVQHAFHFSAIEARPLNIACIDWTHANWLIQQWLNLYYNMYGA